MQRVLPTEIILLDNNEGILKAPSYEEQYIYVGSNPAPYITLLFLCRMSSILGVYIFVYYTQLWIFLPYALILNTYWVAYASYALFTKPFDLIHHKIRIDKFIEERIPYPSVDVFIPTCGEDFRVVVNTIKHALNLDYPGELKVWALDDGDNPILRSNLPEDPKLNYIVRPNRPEGKKGGNLCYAFKKSEGELILILDADFAVSRNFLRETVPYFQQEDLGILQTPQYFRNEDQKSLIGKGAAFCQEIFYRYVQVARDCTNSAGCAGSNVIYRRKALEPWGGTAIVPAAEDRHTAWRLQDKGWKIKYIPLVMAVGECPSSINALYTQAYRWANGATRQITSKEYWAKLPLFNRSTELSFYNWLTFGVSGLSFFVESIGIVIGLVPIIYMYVLHPDLVNWVNSLIFVPSFLWVRLVNPLVSKTKWTPGVLLVGSVVCYSYIMSIISVLMKKDFVWVATGNIKETSKSTLVKRFRFIYPFWTTLQFSLVIGFAIKAINQGYPFHNFLTGIILACLSFSTMLSLFILEKQGKFS